MTLAQVLARSGSVPRDGGTGRTVSPRCPLGRYRPRVVTVHARRRFRRDRLELYLSRLSVPPDDATAALIESLIASEWAAVVAEHDGSLRALVDSREHRRLFQRLRADFERSIAAPPEPSPQDILDAIHHRSGPPA